MPRIVVCMSDPAEMEAVCSGLRLKRHDVTALPPGDAAGTPKEVAAKLRDLKAQVAVMEYVAEDAASVKLLQAASDGGGFPRFIFVLSGGEPVSHVLMAVNEGAAAIMEKPVNPDALSNYVERALSGPSRLRHERSRDEAEAMEAAELEREANAMRMQLASSRKLISYLMSTPATVQHRSVLVVSDSAYQRDYLRKVFEEHGFQVFQAENPEAGLQAALEEKPRVVVSDLEMEGKNGVEFCHELKIVRKFMPCFFVICTANSERIGEVMAPGNGVDGCVLKPSNENGNNDLIATASMGLLL